MNNVNAITKSYFGNFQVKVILRLLHAICNYNYFILLCDIERITGEWQKIID